MVYDMVYLQIHCNQVIFEPYCVNKYNLGDHPVQEALRGQRSLLQAVPKYKTTAVHQVRQTSY